jgi:putative transposase
VLSLYARGLSTRESQGHLEELYGTEVSPTLISTITDAVLDEVRTWQARPLASVYPILYFDALFVGAVPLSRERFFDVPLAHQPGRKDAL